MSLSFDILTRIVPIFICKILTSN